MTIYDPAATATVLFFALWFLLAAAFAFWAGK